MLCIIFYRTKRSTTAEIGVTRKPYFLTVSVLVQIRRAALYSHSPPHNFFFLSLLYYYAGTRDFVRVVNL